jgi:hypothetical protein
MLEVNLKCGDNIGIITPHCIPKVLWLILFQTGSTVSRGPLLLLNVPTPLITINHPVNPPQALQLQAPPNAEMENTVEDNTDPHPPGEPLPHAGVGQNLLLGPLRNDFDLKQKQH